MKHGLACALISLLPAVASAEDDPTALAQTSHLVVDGEAFTSFGWYDGDGQSFSEFSLDRAELGLRSRDGLRVGGELRLEAVRSAGADSVMGVDGDSLVFRVKRAYGRAEVLGGTVTVELRAGLIPDPWIAALEADYGFRAASATLAERAGLHDTSDLGAAAAARLLDGVAILHVAVTNGEGRNQIEQNPGKSTSAVLSVRPLELDLAGSRTRLRLHAAARDGSRGAGQVRDHRLAGAVTFHGEDVSAGVEYTRAYGYAGMPDRVADGVGLWAGGRYRPRRVGGLVRVDLLREDVATAGTDGTTTTLGVFADLAERPYGELRLYALGQDERAGDLAGPVAGVPEAIEARRVLIILSVGGSMGELP